VNILLHCMAAFMHSSLLFACWPVWAPTLVRMFGLTLPTHREHVLCNDNLGCLQTYPQNWMQSQNSFYPGCYIESCNRMCRLRYRENDGQVSCCSPTCHSQRGYGRAQPSICSLDACCLPLLACTLLPPCAHAYACCSCG
jgi:hypothetical protein